MVFTKVLNTDSIWIRIQFGSGSTRTATLVPPKKIVKISVFWLPRRRTARERQFLPASWTGCERGGCSLLVSTDSLAVRVTKLPPPSTTLSTPVTAEARRLELLLAFVAVVVEVVVVGKLGLKKHMIGLEKWKVSTV